MDTVVSILKKFPFFYTVSDVLLERVGRIGAERSYAKDECVFSEGERPGLMGLIIEGRIKVVKHSPEGRDVIVRVIDRGQIFGEVAVFDNKPYPASAIAMADTKAFVLERHKLMELLNGEPQIALDIISDLGRKLRDMLDTVKSIATEHVDKRIVFTLLKLYEAGAGPVLKIKRQDIAEMCGTTVETAIRVTRELEKSGSISTERGKIALSDIAALRAYLEK
ncbi:MAG: Crp/Fnr family transcriptional regulator [Deltaproteobacteria bacterium]|nr:Crp/Fnr family transcriptional regulator [Deltaproteobacteria bacterium]